MPVICTVHNSLWFYNLQKKPGGELVEKVISSYKHLLRAPIDEDKLMRKCNSALSFVDNLNKEYGNSNLGKIYVYRISVYYFTSHPVFSIIWSFSIILALRVLTFCFESGRIN